MNSLRTLKHGSRMLAPLVALTLLFAAAAVAQTYTPLFTYPGTNRNNTGVLFPQILSQGRDGNLYSTIVSDGTQTDGTAYRITTAGVPTTIYNFCSLASCADGEFPSGGLTLGTDGNLYGTTTGAAFNFGTVFKVSPTGTLTTLFHFTSNADEGYPSYTVFQGQDGNFYGVDPGVFAGTFGVVFKMTPTGKVTPHAFSSTNGSNPNLPVQGLDGNFYGTTQTGGDPTCQCGVVYKMTAAGKISVLHAFKGGATDGFRPLGTLVQGSDGNFYGTTFEGGINNQGIVFKISATGTFTLVHSFNSTFTNLDGAMPETGLTLGTDGNFYGTTSVGGKTTVPNYGAIYQITPAGNEKIVYSFCSATNCVDGINPQTPLVQHTNGKFYGNTSGSSLCCSTFYSFDMGLVPFAKLVTISGKVGSTAEILGQGFTGTTSVSFNGSPATSFKIVSDTYLTAIVPVGASTGNVKVVTPGGTLTSSRAFVVVPVISSFNPTSGPVGTSVTITGSGFTGATKVVIGGKAATFTVNNNSQITATVAAGAKAGKILVTTPGGTATSTGAFSVTP